MKTIFLISSSFIILLILYLGSKPSTFDENGFTLPWSSIQEMHFSNGTKYNTKKSGLIQIIEVKVIKQTYDSALFEISYIYNGDSNKPLYLGASQRLGGEIQGWFAYRPSKPLKKGEGKALVNLAVNSETKKKAKEHFSDQIEINAYHGGESPIHEELFGFSRTWCSHSDPFWKMDSPCRTSLFNF